MTRLLGFLFLPAALAAAPIPEPPPDFVPLEQIPAVEACGPWTHGNETVTRAVAKEAITALTRYAHWKDQNSVLNGGHSKLEYSEYRDGQARLQAQAAFWSIGLWAAGERWALFSAPLWRIQECLNDEVEGYHGKNPDCREAHKRFGEIAEKIKVRGRLEVTNRGLEREPPRALVRWARRKVGCGLFPKKVAPAPAYDPKQDDLIAAYKQARAEIATSWEQHYRANYAAEIQLASMKERAKQREEAAARQKAQAAAAAAARVIDEKADPYRAAIRGVTDVAFVKAVADTAAQQVRMYSSDTVEHLRKFELSDGTEVSLLVRQAPWVVKALRQFERGPANVAEGKLPWAGTTASDGSVLLASAQILAWSRRNPGILQHLPSQGLLHALQQIPPKYAAPIQSILSSRGRAASRARAEAEARDAAQAAARQASRDAEAAERAARYRKAQADAQASMAAWRARRGTPSQGMSKGVRDMHEKWNRSRYEKGVKDGWVKPR